MPRCSNCFLSSPAASSSSCGMSLGSISMIVTFEPKRWKIEANSQPMIPPPRPASRPGPASWASPRGGQPGRAAAALRVDARDRRAQRVGAGGDDRLLEGHVVVALDGDGVRVPEAAGALHPLDPVRLEEAGDALRELTHDRGLPRVRGSEVELWLPHLHAELAEGLLRLLERVRGLHPRLRRDAADAQARAAESLLLLDADRLRAELGGADGGGVAAGASAEDGDVTLHAGSPRVEGRAVPRSYRRPGTHGD